MVTTPTLGAIADDVTGGTDLGDGLVRAGLRTVQALGLPAGPVTDALLAETGSALTVICPAFPAARSTGHTCSSATSCCPTPLCATTPSRR